MIPPRAKNLLRDRSLQQLIKQRQAFTLEHSPSRGNYIPLRSRCVSRKILISELNSTK